MARLNAKWLIGGAVVGGAVALTKIVRERRAERRANKALPLVGEVCRVTSRRVSRRRGEANFHDGQGGQVVKVRCARGQKITQGNLVRLKSYNAKTNTFEVEPIVYD